MWAKEWMLARASASQWFTPWTFFALVAFLLCFAINPLSGTIIAILPKLLMVAVLLSILLFAEQAFKGDWQDGSLHQFALSQQGLGAWLLCRFALQGIILLLPLIVLAGLIAWGAGVEPSVVQALVLALCVLGPSLYVIALTGSALTVALPQSAFLTAIMLFPLYIPPMILLEVTLERAQWGESLGFVLGLSWFYFLASLSLLAVIRRLLCLAMR